MSVLRAAATSADLDFIEGLQNRPEFAAMVAADGRDALEAALADPARALLIWERAGAPRGFALLVLERGPARVEIRRMIHDAPGQGEGRDFLDSVIARGFDEPWADKVYLDVAADNPRAIRAYAEAGLVPEGRLREHWRRADGARVDLVVMGMLRREWDARRDADPA